MNEIIKALEAYFNEVEKLPEGSYEWTGEQTDYDKAFFDLKLAYQQWVKQNT